MEQRRSIQDMVPPARNRPLREHPQNVPQQQVPPPPSRPPRQERSGEKPSQRGWFYASAIALFLVFVGVVLAQTVFRGASLTVIPNQRTVTIDAVLTAAKEGAGTGLTFQVMSLEESASQKVPATGEETVNERASGTIVVYNKGSKDQRLIPNTRFETPEGLVYKVQKSITIPAAKSGTPGSLEITVYADEPGDRYNIGLSDFTLPGLKGSAQFQEIYARSKTPMVGGFIGTRKTVDAAARDAARQSLRESLQASLGARARSDIPEGFVLPENGVFTAYESLPDASEGNDAVISERGLAHVIIFPVDALASEIARGAIGSYDGLPVTVADPSTLSAEIAEPGSAPWESDAVSVRVSGFPHIVWVVDETALKAALLGKSRKELSSILAGFGAIDRAEASLYPLWSGSFPDEAEKIRIRQVIEPEASVNQ